MRSETALKGSKEVSLGEIPELSWSDSKADSYSPSDSVPEATEGVVLGGSGGRTSSISSDLRLRSTRYSGRNSRVDLNSVECDFEWRERVGDGSERGLVTKLVSAIRSRWTAGGAEGLRKRIGTAVEDSRRGGKLATGLVTSGNLVGEPGLDSGKGGSSSGKASNSQG